MDYDTLAEINHLIKDLGVFSKLLTMPKESLKSVMAKSIHNNDIIASYHLTLGTAIEFAKEIDDKLNTQQYPALWEQRKNRHIIESEQTYKEIIEKISKEAINNINYTILATGPGLLKKLSFFKTGPIDSSLVGQGLWAPYYTRQKGRSGYEHIVDLIDDGHYFCKRRDCTRLAFVCNLLQKNRPEDMEDIEIDLLIKIIKTGYQKLECWSAKIKVKKPLDA